MTPRPDSTPGDPDTLGSLGPLADAMGIKLQEARPGRVVATMPVEGNTQPFGLLNGGASAVMAETLGSLAGMLHAGPQGAGARPGPASYSLGGTRPTVTDAQLVLGRLAPGPYAGGAIALDLERAVRAMRRAIEAAAERIRQAIEHGIAVKKREVRLSLDVLVVSSLVYLALYWFTHRPEGP